MQDTRRIQNPRNHSRHILKAVSICLLGLALQACQTGQTRYMSAEDRNAETNAWAGFANAAFQFTNAQRSTHIPGAPMRQVQSDPNPFIQAPQPVILAPQQSPWGEGNLWGE